ncbi:MAG: TatD family hydrolase [Chitinophagaceae bacterium]|jgi:TatD DNase family protein|nr:TatD family hydrolase [Chitinophagaceae bacterium]OQY96320.1 MAG: hydrolase TatD [Sphingobacteriales bacterium UTBCD1]
MKLVDTHSHIFLSEFDHDRKEAIDRAEKESVMKILMPAIDSETHVRVLETEKNFPGQCLSMMALHPCSVKENYKEEIKIVSGYLKQRKFIAIGEAGLDFYWDLTYKDQQIEVFQQQIEWAMEHDIPIVIHSRNSIDECIEIARKNQKGKLKGVFHCFSGTSDQAHQIIDLGFYLGIGGVLTFKKSGLDKVMSGLNMANVVLETDAPYLAPVPYRGKRNEPAYIKYVAQKLAEVKQLPLEEIARITTQNAVKLFGL